MDNLIFHSYDNLKQINYTEFENIQIPEPQFPHTLSFPDTNVTPAFDKDQLYKFLALSQLPTNKLCTQ